MKNPNLIIKNYKRSIHHLKHIFSALENFTAISALRIWTRHPPCLGTTPQYSLVLFLFWQHKFFYKLNHLNLNCCDYLIKIVSIKRKLRVKNYLEPRTTIPVIPPASASAALQLDAWYSGGEILCISLMTNFWWVHIVKHG